MSISGTQLWKFLFVDIADPRVRHWTFMDNPSYVVGLILIYYYLIYGLVPKYMAKKKPYELKGYIQCYNVFQVIACSFIIYRTVKSGWRGWNTLTCLTIDYSENETAILLAGCFWWNMMIKMAELTETIVFALRKKSNQISGLHVFHHVSTLVVAWISTKYTPGGMVFVTLVLNSMVHVLMYTYYFLTSLGPEWQKSLAPFKSKLTLIQMVQLIFLLFHTLQSLAPNCDVPIYFPIIFIPVLAGDIYLFLKFYQKTYINKKKH